MKTILPLSSLIAVLAPAAAMAHGGAHLHPHGVEGWVVGLGIVAMIAGGAVSVRVARRGQDRK
ncbi:hypothetical protein E4Z66_12725 [Aliishimia ponticola]|uniref:Peptidase M23 n=1 Tax=Aliishimia ponticola TaxID=2499833 RepID=A0A4S4NBT5_9RHOB|nr:hypothetical protein [Aliishimia ponticola]THH35927.1 hypothetical protein E4Z66_12725 [Aliishimia ponticola]